jgi:prepilin signal peptidase PulO-like enzyme (type II secretory pathway)
LAYFLSGKKLGLADVWYSALIGFVHGLWRWYFAIGIACIIGVVFILISRRRKIPFIPFMAIGSILSFCLPGIKNG